MKAVNPLAKHPLPLAGKATKTDSTPTTQPTAPRLAKAKLLGFIPNPDFTANAETKSFDFVSTASFDLHLVGETTVRITSRVEPFRSIVAPTAWVLYE